MSNVQQQNDSLMMAITIEKVSLRIALIGTSDKYRVKNIRFAILYAQCEGNITLKKMVIYS